MCSSSNLKSEESQQTAIKLSEFWGIFLILIIGYLVGLVVFLGELCFHHNRRRC